MSKVCGEVGPHNGANRGSNGICRSNKQGHEERRGQHLEVEPVRGRGERTTMKALGGLKPPPRSIYTREALGSDEYFYILHARYS